MDFRCKRCKQEELRCFVEMNSGRCASCICTTAECSLLTSEQDWERVERERREIELQIARLKLRLAQSKVALLELKDRERSYTCQDLAFSDLQDRAKAQAEGSSSPVTS